jgi:hypothetical protein
VDVTVQCDVPTDHLVRALATYGFSLRIDATDAFVRTTRVVPLEHLGSGLAVDVVLAGPGLEELFLERALPVDIAGISVPFISPEDLIVTSHDVRPTCLRATLFLVAENQNVTLSVPRAVLKRAKRLAADRETSVSALMTEALVRMTEDDRRYAAAKKRALAAMASGRSLGTRGQRTWTRDELHER